MTVSIWAATAAVPSMPPEPEASCPPPPDHLLVPPVGAAWIGSLDGIFEYPDWPPRAVWSIEEVLIGAPAVTDGVLVYAQPGCDPILSGGFTTRFLVTTADPASPTSGNTVAWQISAGDHVSPIYPEGGQIGSVYDVDTLEAARALVLSGQMPAGIPPTPSPCDILASPSPGGAAPADVDGVAAHAALDGYLGDVHAHRFRAAWDRLSAERQAMWGSFDDFKAGSADREDKIGTATNDAAAFCGYLEGHDFGDADLSRAWLFEVTHGPGSNDWRDEWIVAPLPDGTWRLWQVR